MSGTNPQRPNFLLIVGEDTGRWLGCYGDDYATTPNLDRLAAQGCRFDNAYSTAPVCAPSRSCLVSGQYQMKIGSHHMRSTLVNPPRTFTRELRDAGYYVSWPTKLDFNFEPQEGWRDDDDMWIDRLRSGEMPDQPWFAFVNIGITHESGMWPHKEGKHAPAVHDPADANVPPYVPDVDDVREDIARHADNFTELDRQVGEILDALEQSGEAGNTVVMYLTDHGRGLPREKRWCFSGGIHLPLIIRWPGRIDAGSSTDQLVSWVDLAPTILSLAGVDIPERYDGVVFLGDAATTRDCVFAGRDRMDEAFDRVRVARNKRYHYIRNYWPQLPYAQRIRYMEQIPTMRALRSMHEQGLLQGSAAVFMAERKAAEELFDVAADPHCVSNLADDPAHADAKRELSQAMDEWIECIDDLGAVTERELIERGIVINRLDGEYRDRVEPLPKRHRIGPPRTLVEQSEAEAWIQTGTV